MPLFNLTGRHTRPGQQATVNLSLDRTTDDGLSGYDVTLRLPPGFSVANTQFPRGESGEQIWLSDANSTDNRVVAADLLNNIQGVQRDIPLATITLNTPAQRGCYRLGMSIGQADDDNGDPITPLQFRALELVSVPLDFPGFYQIVDLGTVQGTNHLFYCVRFWPSAASHAAGDPFILEQHFSLNLPTDQASRIIRNEDGWLQRDDTGEFVPPRPADDETPHPPYRRESYVIDVAAEIHHTIDLFWRNAIIKGWIGPEREPIVHTDADPLGYLAKPEVAALVGATKDMMA